MADGVLFFLSNMEPDGRHQKFSMVLGGHKNYALFNFKLNALFFVIFRYLLNLQGDF